MAHFDVRRISKSTGQESVRRVVASDASEAQFLAMDDQYLVGEATRVHGSDETHTSNSSRQPLQKSTSIGFLIVFASACVSAAIYFRPKDVSTTTMTSYPYAFPPVMALPDGSVLLAGVAGRDATIGRPASAFSPKWYVIGKDGLARPVTVYPGNKEDSNDIYHIFAIGSR